MGMRLSPLLVAAILLAVASAQLTTGASCPATITVTKTSWHVSHQQDSEALRSTAPRSTGALSDRTHTLTSTVWRAVYCSISSTAGCHTLEGQQPPPTSISSGGFQTLSISSATQVVKVRADALAESCPDAVVVTATEYKTASPSMPKPTSPRSTQSTISSKTSSTKSESTISLEETHSTRIIASSTSTISGKTSSGTPGSGEGSTGTRTKIGSDTSATTKLSNTNGRPTVSRTPTIVSGETTTSKTESRGDETRASTTSKFAVTTESGLSSLVASSLSSSEILESETRSKSQTSTNLFGTGSYTSHAGPNASAWNTSGRSSRPSSGNTVSTIHSTPSNDPCSPQVQS